MKRATSSYFLGGYDLEMVTIRKLLEESGATFHDKRLGWGACASAYRSEIETALAQGQKIVLIELNPDFEVPTESTVLVDHHADRAGSAMPSSLRQIFELLDLPASRWTRELALVEANDRGHIRAMQDIGATRDEIARIRAADRAAQGVTAEEERAARTAIEKRMTTLNGDLTSVRLPHARASVVADLMHQELGGPGYVNLVVLSPNEVNVFAEGWIIRALADMIPDGWWGGDLPERGFWGCRLPASEVSERLAPANE